MLTLLAAIVASCAAAPVAPDPRPTPVDTASGNPAGERPEAPWRGTMIYDAGEARVVRCALPSGIESALVEARAADSLGPDALVIIESTARFVEIIRDGVRTAVFDGGDELSLFELRFAPDRARIAFSHLEPGTLRVRTRVIDTAGAILATIDDAASPTWLPDGRLVVSGTWRYPYADDAPIVTPVEGGLYMLDSAMTRVARLALGIDRALHPAMSPDGGRIAFVREGDVWTIQTNAEGLRRVTSGAMDGSYPSWSPDGDFIALQTGAAGARALAIVESTGTTEVVESAPIWLRSARPRGPMIWTR